MYKNSQTLIISGELGDLNTWVKAINSHYIVGNLYKKKAEHIVYWSAKKQKLTPIQSPCYIEYHWYCKNKRKDKSNIASFGIKVIEDALQKAGILLQDNWKAIDGYSNQFYTDKENPRIIINLKY